MNVEKWSATNWVGLVAVIAASVAWLTDQLPDLLFGAVVIVWLALRFLRKRPPG